MRRIVCDGLIELNGQLAAAPDADDLVRIERRVEHADNAGEAECGARVTSWRAQGCRRVVVRGAPTDALVEADDGVGEGTCVSNTANEQIRENQVHVANATFCDAFGFPGRYSYSPSGRGAGRYGRCT